MPRSNWNGYISFGLVSIPVVLFNAIDPKSTVSFKQINRKTGAKIKYKRIDVETEKEVPWEQIGKGYEYDKDVILPVEDKDLKMVAGDNARTIAIEEFIDKKHITFLNVDKTYYLVPGKKGEKGYVILREALASSNKVGIAKVIISTKEYLAAVATFEDALVLYLLHYNSEIRQLDDFDIPSDNIKTYKVTTKELEVAKKLINSMTAKWKPEKYKDEYRLAVQKWVGEKIKHLPQSKMQPRSHALKPSEKAINFVDLLRKSLETSRPSKTISNGKRKTITARHIPQKQKTTRKTVRQH